MSLWQEKKECTKKQKWEAGGEVLAVGGKVCSQNSVKTSCNIKKNNFWEHLFPMDNRHSSESYGKFLEYKLQNNMVRKVGVSYVSSCATSRSRLTTGNRTGVNPKYIIWKSLRQASSSHEWVMMISQPLWSFWRHSPLVKTNAFPHCQRYDTFQLTREKFCYEAKIYFQSDLWPCSNHLLLTLFGIFSFSFLHDNKAPRNKTGLWSDLRAVAADCIHLKMYDGLKSIFSHINYQWKRNANRVVTQNFRTNHIRNIIIWTMQTKLHMLLLNPPLIIPLKQFHHQNMIV